MYTVLIQSKKTLECFQHFESLFHEDIENGRIGLCQWNRAGSSIETALPELYDQIADKDMWRAVLVQTDTEDDDAEFITDRINPFDHLYYRDCKGFEVKDGDLVNSPIPLVRLTHLLGGIPAPEPEFETETIIKENRVPRVVFKPVDEIEQKKRREAFERWTKKNALKESTPIEIILIRVQMENTQIDAEKQVESSWEVHNEYDSSEFWKRNLYPPSCRFIYYGIEQGGTVRRQADLFRLWTSVLLIAQNDIDPNVLQAHRLYRLGIQIDTEKLGYSLQESADKLNRARNLLEKSIAKDRENEKIGAEAMPDIQLKIPVEFTSPTVKRINVEDDEFGLFGGASSADRTYWGQYVGNAFSELKSILKNVDRNLDRASGQLRDLYGFTDVQVKTLSKYQEEDLRYQLAETEGDLQKAQETLPEQLPELAERIAEANAQVKKEILKRMTVKQFAVALAYCAIAYVCSLIPAIYLSDNKLVPIAMSLIGIALAALVGIIVLIVQRNKLIEVAGIFQEKFMSVVRELARDATSYTGFLSDVATHTHGSTYINILEDRRRRRDSAYYRKLSHLKSVERALQRIGMWSNALNVPTDIEALSIPEDDMPDVINFDTLYALDEGKDYKVELNDTGLYIQSPFGFIDTLEIVREGIYDSV